MFLFLVPTNQRRNTPTSTTYRYVPGTHKYCCILLLLQCFIHGWVSYVHTLRRQRREPRAWSLDVKQAESVDLPISTPLCSCYNHRPNASAPGGFMNLWILAISRAYKLHAEHFCKQAERQQTKKNSCHCLCSAACSVEFWRHNSWPTEQRASPAYLSRMYRVYSTLDFIHHLSWDPMIPHHQTPTSSQLATQTLSNLKHSNQSRNTTVSEFLAVGYPAIRKQPDLNI